MSNLSESRPCENREVSVSLCYHNMRSHFRTVYSCIQMEFGERYRQIDLFRLASFFTFKTYRQRCHYKNQGCNVAFFSPTPFLYSLLLLFFLSFSFVSVILSLQQAKKRHFGSFPLKRVQISLGSLVVQQVPNLPFFEVESLQYGSGGGGGGGKIKKKYEKNALKAILPLPS